MHSLEEYSINQEKLLYQISIHVNFLSSLIQKKLIWCQQIVLRLVPNLWRMLWLAVSVSELWLNLQWGGQKRDFAAQQYMSEEPTILWGDWWRGRS